MKRFVSVFMISFVVAVTSIYAAKIEGDQQYVNRSVKVGNFYEVKVMSNFNVVYHQSPDSAGHIKIYGEDNIVRDIDVKLNKGVLDLRFKNTSKRDYGVVIINIYSSGLTKVECDNGSTFETRGVISGEDIYFSLLSNGQIKATNLKFQRIKAKIIGNGDMLLQGVSSAAELSVIGGGEIRAHDLKSQEVKCSITGNGNIGCYAISALNATITGPGDVYYNGNPKLKRRVIGSGKIRSLEGHDKD